MNNSRQKYNTKMYFLLAILTVSGWTLLLVGMVLIEFNKIELAAENIAIAEARANFNKDQAFRHWAALRGGVYVPVDSLTTPNPGLSHIPGRDAETASGKKLTLMNPAFMIREMNDYFASFYGIVGHITSTKLTRPENKPDEWETNALLQFEKGVKEVREFIEMDNTPYLRLMQPMIAEKECLECHAHQGYQVGDIRGGVSISLPLTYIYDQAENHKKRYTNFLLIVWTLGVTLIILGYKRLFESNQKQIRAENSLRIQNKELIFAKQRAEESDRLKSAFLANMSHEIRTPMNGILGFAELLKTPNLEESEQQKYIDVIEKSGNRMLNTINDIVDISRIEAGHVIIKLSEVNLNTLTQYLYDFFALEVNKKGMQITQRIESKSQNAIVKTDEEKLNSILINLIKNAIKYSHQGKIEFGYTMDDLTVNLSEDKIDETTIPNRNGEVLFFVKDTGIGIPENKQKTIFNRFDRVDIGDKKIYEGSGLGLTISKAYVEMLGGSINLISKEDKGTLFYFTIPNAN